LFFVQRTVEGLIVLCSKNCQFFVQRTVAKPGDGVKKDNERLNDALDAGRKNAAFIEAIDKATRGMNKDQRTKFYAELREHIDALISELNALDERDKVKRHEN
jgi:hypothetical protein